MATKTVYIFVSWYSTSTFKCTEMKASRRWQVCLTLQTEPVVNSQTLACFLNGSHCSTGRQATRQHGLLASLACKAASCLYQSAFTRPKLEAYSWTWPLTKKKKENKNKNPLMTLLHRCHDLCSFLLTAAGKWREELHSESDFTVKLQHSFVS